MIFERRKLPCPRRNVFTSAVLRACGRGLQTLNGQDYWSDKISSDFLHCDILIIELSAISHRNIESIEMVAPPG